MKRFLENIIKNHDRVFQIFIVFIFSFLIAFFVSDKTIHSFDFQKGSNWNYDDLYADFDFSLFKTEQELAENKKAIELFSDVYYEKDTLIKYQSLSNFELELKTVFRSKNKVSKYYEIGKNILLKIYKNGVIELRELDQSKDVIYLINPEFEKFNSQNAKKINLSKFSTMEDAISIINNEIEIYFDDYQFLKELLIKSIDFDVTFNSYYTGLLLNQAFENISLKKGLIKEGDLIVKKNQFIDSESFQKLDSYKKELSLYINKKDYATLFLGNFFLALLILGLCFVFLLNFYGNLLVSNASFLLIFFYYFIFCWSFIFYNFF